MKGQTEAILNELDKWLRELDGSATVELKSWPNGFTCKLGGNKIFANGGATNIPEAIRQALVSWYE